MACKLDTEDLHSSQTVICEVCADVQEATNHCDDCLVNFCDRCAKSHEKLSNKGRHSVQTGVCDYELDLELCPEDGQLMSFYCGSCQERVCPECELNKKAHVMHTVVSLSRHTGQEKEKLLDKLDDIITKTETISHVPDDVKSMAIRIELKWLERKELIRQEFASLIETISTREKQLLADMEEEVQRSLKCLSQLQQDHNTVLSDACQLSDECISAVQNLHRNQFLKSYPEFMDRWMMVRKKYFSVKGLENKVERIDSAEDHMPAFLKVPFSLHKEKLHLHNCLQFHTFNGCQSIKVREYHRFVPVDRLKEEMSISKFVEAPLTADLPPSTSVRYSVEIYCGSKHSKKPVWRSRRPLKAADTIINGSGSCQLLPGVLYVVKIQPTVTCTNHQGDRSMKGRVVSLIVVTDIAPGTLYKEPAVAAGDSKVVADTNGLLGNYSSGASAVPNLKYSSNGNENNSCIIRRGSRFKESSKNCVKSLFCPVIPSLVSFSNASSSASGDFTLSNAYRCEMPAGASYRKCCITDDPNAALCCQQRYLQDLSFEEARLMEDGNLKLTRLVLFEN